MGKRLSGRRRWAVGIVIVLVIAMFGVSSFITTSKMIGDTITCVDSSLTYPDCGGAGELIATESVTCTGFWTPSYTVEGSGGYPYAYSSYSYGICLIGHWFSNGVCSTICTETVATTLSWTVVNGTTHLLPRS
jgi:hypothetical protein